MKANTTTALLAALSVAVIGIAQSSVSFEVATIKRTAPDWSGGRIIRMPSAHQFVAKNHSLKTLVAAAYNLNPRMISGGPPWVDEEHYDILATTPGDARPTPDEQMAMLRQLLADRCSLTFHREQKTLSIYALTVARKGPKVKPSTAPPEEHTPLSFVIYSHFVRLPGKNATMVELASVMQRAALDRPVVDQTGLRGRYDFELAWTPDETQFGGALGKQETVDNDAKPGLFTAVQEQLGLRLTATKGPVAALVIDRIARPSEN